MLQSMRLVCRPTLFACRPAHGVLIWDIDRRMESRPIFSNKSECHLTVRLIPEQLRRVGLLNLLNAMRLHVLRGWKMVTVKSFELT